MHTRTSEIPVQWPTNTIIMGGHYEMEGGQVARVYGVRRLMDGTLRLMMEIEEGNVQEFTAQQFDTWVRR